MNRLPDQQDVNMSGGIAPGEMSLTAIRNSMGILLKWSVETEFHTERFDILHSRDGVHFSRIADIYASGHGLFTSHYSWIHTTPAHGNNFYRIQRFHTDGSFLISETRSII